MELITSVGGTLITFFGSIISALFGASGSWSSLKEYFMLGICVSLILVGAKVIRKFVWGS